MDGLRIATVESDGRVLELHGEADFSSLELLRLHLHKLEEAGGDVVVDLADVEHFDSTALGALIGSRKRLGDHGARLLLRNPSPSVMRVLDVTGLVRLFEIELRKPGPAPR